MKKHFDFTLTGTRLLPVWLVFYILIILPYVFYFKSLTGHTHAENSFSMNGFLSIGLIFVAFIISFYIFKVIIESVKYSDSQVKFDGDFATFLGTIILGMIFSIVTLFIYTAWFVRDITRVIVNGCSVNGIHFNFQGKGGKLFLILLLSVFLPIIFLTIMLGDYIMIINQSLLLSLLFKCVTTIIMVPYTYLSFKWMINIKFNEYQLMWKTEFGPSCLKILTEMVLIMITLGIYWPLGYLKLYKYFAERTFAESSDKTLRFGYELDAEDDFFFIWGQTLLTIITIGIYYPWAFSRIGKRILQKTYTENYSSLQPVI